MYERLGQGLPYSGANGGRMNLTLLGRKTWMAALALLAVVAITVVAMKESADVDQRMEGKTKLRREALPAAEPVAAAGPWPASVELASASTGFAPQQRMGFFVNNEWEPAIAADRSGHVYILYPQYGGVPGCATCYSPTMILQMSSDHGQTFASPTVISPAGSTSYQVDAQIAVDPVDGKTVYASWLQNNKSDIVVAKSTDFGASWSVVTADHTNAGTDKPILAVRGQGVYVSYNHAQTAYVTYSHDGAASFTEVKMN